MGFKTHRQAAGLGQGDRPEPKPLLLVPAPAVAASDHRHLQGRQDRARRQLLLQLGQVAIHPARQVGHVVAPGHQFHHEAEIGLTHLVGGIGEGTLEKHRVAQVQLQAIEAPALGPVYGGLQASLEAPEAVEQKQIHGLRRARGLVRALLAEGNGSSVATGTTGPGQGRDHPWADSCF